jgi:uncharacterized membrane protein
MFDLTAHDKHPPFYYGILHFWIKPFGDSEAALRAPSAIIGAATAVLLAAVAWWRGGSLLGLASGVFLLLNAGHIGPSQEARMYVFVGFFALASSAALAWLISSISPVRFGLYVGLAIAMVYTHYSGLLVLSLHAAVLAFYGVLEVAEKRRGWLLFSGLASALVISLSYIPWLSTFKAHYEAGVPYVVSEPDRAFLQEVGRALLGLEPAGNWTFALVVALLAAGVFGVGRRWRDPFIVCLAAVALVPVLQIVSSMRGENIFSLRQAAPYTSGLAFVMAVGLVELYELAKRLPKQAAQAGGGGHRGDRHYRPSSHGAVPRRPLFRAHEARLAQRGSGALG